MNHETTYRGRGDVSADTLPHWLFVAAETVLDLLRLMKAEIGITLSRIPALCILGIVMLQFVLLLWIGLSVLLSWTVAVAAGSTLAGLAAFLLLQLVCTLGLFLKIRTLLKSMSLPLTRANMDRIRAAVGEYSGRGAQ